MAGAGGGPASEGLASDGAEFGFRPSRSKARRDSPVTRCMYACSNPRSLRPRGNYRKRRKTLTISARPSSAEGSLRPPPRAALQEFPDLPQRFSPACQLQVCALRQPTEGQNKVGIDDRFERGLYRCARPRPGRNRPPRKGVRHEARLPAQAPARLIRRRGRVRTGHPGPF